MFATSAAEVGRPGFPPTGRGSNYEAGGMVVASGPNEIADRILELATQSPVTGFSAACGSAVAWVMTWSIKP